MQTISRRALLAGAASVAATAAPSLTVTDVRRAFHNGEHNAFTDLIRFRGRLYLTFRTCPEGHMLFPSSRILVLESEDGAQWRQVHEFSAPRRDVRDPHFLEFNGKLFVYSGTWFCGDSPPKTRDMNEMLGFVSHTADGRAWSSPEPVEGSYGHYIWRAAAHGGKAYLCARRKRMFEQGLDGAPNAQLVEAAILESDDGLRFRKAGLFQHEFGDETAFLFESDGSVLAVSRRGGNRTAELGRATAPDQPFERRDLGRYIGGPMLVRWRGNYLVGGRRLLNPKEPAAVLYWLDPFQARLTEAAVLPSGGDCSYPGFVETGPGPGRGLVSWYSTHETVKAAIYLASVRVG